MVEGGNIRCGRSHCFAILLSLKTINVRYPPRQKNEDYAHVYGPRAVKTLINTRYCFAFGCFAIALAHGWMMRSIAILAGVVWHQYANLVFSIHLDFKRLHDLLGRI